MWVEFAEPYYLPEDDIPDDLIQAVQKREWVEPQAISFVLFEMVYDLILHRLRPMYQVGTSMVHTTLSLRLRLG